MDRGSWIVDHGSWIMDQGQSKNKCLFSILTHYVFFSDAILKFSRTHARTPTRKKKKKAFRVGVYRIYTD